MGSNKSVVLGMAVLAAVVTAIVCDVDLIIPHTRKFPAEATHSRK